MVPVADTGGFLETHFGRCRALAGLTDSLAVADIEGVALEAIAIQKPRSVRAISTKIAMGFRLLFASRLIACSLVFLRIQFCAAMLSTTFSLCTSHVRALVLWYILSGLQYSKK